MDVNTEKRIVMTLDAGGTNFTFSAIQNYLEIINPQNQPAHSTDLNNCISCIIKGFSDVMEKLPEKPVAISFAFPGPADYPNGIITNPPNLPAFSGGVALGPLLEDKFGLPVFINNDGDLFTYGEAIAGFLPYVNNMLEKSGSPKHYNNLLGITLGTGFGAGIVRNHEIFIGDNSNGAEIWLTRNKTCPQCFVEEGASARAIQRVYYENAGDKSFPELSPKEIFEIAEGKRNGNLNAARKAFIDMAEVVGDALANAITLIDGLIVIGGGLSGAHSIFLSKIAGEMNSTIEFIDGHKLSRLVQRVYNLEDQNDLQTFLTGNKKELQVPFSNRKILYDAEKRIGLGISKLGTSRAVSIGAYSFALNKIDNKINYK